MPTDAKLFHINENHCDSEAVAKPGSLESRLPPLRSIDEVMAEVYTMLENAGCADVCTNYKGQFDKLDDESKRDLYKILHVLDQVS